MPSRHATLDERNRGATKPIPVHAGPGDRRILGHARTASGAMRIYRREGVPALRAFETNSRPPSYVPILK